MISDILALGDCNTLGVKELKGDAYPERLASVLGKSVDNFGYTMSTTREMLHFFNDHQGAQRKIILIQYGLVDSWKTFQYAPYVLYYPDNFLRKIARKIVKKYKKTAKSMGLNTRLGVTNVVPVDEYEENIRTILEQTKHSEVFLIDTIPHQDHSRNSEIKRYNQVLYRLSKAYAHVNYVELYHDLLDKTEFYLDKTHLNHEGYQHITDKLLLKYDESRIS